MKVVDISYSTVLYLAPLLREGGCVRRATSGETDNVIVGFFKFVVINRPNFSYHGYFYADPKHQISWKHFRSFGDKTCERQHIERQLRGLLYIFPLT